MNEISILLVGFVLGLVLLYYGADWLVRGGSAIAARACVSPLIVGLTLVAFGTSAPELFVSVGAANAGLGDICIGNVVGSNICNIALILGVSALVSPLTVNPVLLKRDIPVMILASVVVTGFCLSGNGLGRLVGALFVLAIIAYTVMGIRSSGESCKTESSAMGSRRAWWCVIVGLLALVGGARLVLSGAVTIEEALGVPDEIVALTVVAVGTSLPELATSVVAARKGEPDIAVGNIVGSNIFNILGILGVSALWRPVTIVDMDGVDFAAMIVLAIVLWPIMKLRGRIGRAEGVLFLCAYALYVVWLFYSKE